MREIVQFIPAPIIAGLVACGIVTLLAVLLDRRAAPDRAVRQIGAPEPEPRWVTASWPVALGVLAGFVAAYRVALETWPMWPLSGNVMPSDHRIFWGVLVFAGAAAVDSLPRVPGVVRLSLLLCVTWFGVHWVLGSLVRDYTGASGVLLTAGLMAWLLTMRAGLDVSTRHASWKPFDAVIVAVSIGFMGAALAGTGTLKFGQLAWGLGGAAGAVALGVCFRRGLPTAPAYATVLALSLGTLLMLGVFAGDNTLPWWAALLVSFAPAGRFLSRVGPLAKLKGWPTLVVRALLVLAPAALGAGLAVAATTDFSNLPG
jgi:hypothetical protein